MSGRLASLIAAVALATGVSGSVVLTSRPAAGKRASM